MHSTVVINKSPAVNRSSSIARIAGASGAMCFGKHDCVVPGAAAGQDWVKSLAANVQSRIGARYKAEGFTL